MVDGIQTEELMIQEAIEWAEKLGSNPFNAWFAVDKEELHKVILTDYKIEFNYYLNEIQSE